MKIITKSEIESSCVVKIFKNQIYEEIVQDAKFNGHKFIDSEYAPDNKIIFYSNKFELNVPWNRPSDLTKRPCLIIDGPACCTNMVNKEAKMKNFISVCGALSRNPSLIKYIIPNLKKQKSRYCENPEDDPGVFHFYFWKFGMIWDVTIDDLLPMSPADKKLLFSHSDDYSEFWVSLLEKAYAKFNYNDYESIKNRTIAEILVDMTSGVYEPITNLKKENSVELLEKLRKYLLFKDILIFSFTECDSNDRYSQVKRYKEDEGNGYTLLKIIDIQVKPIHENCFEKNEYCLFKFFSPWKSYNYDGPWSTSSTEWQSLMNNIREEYGLALESANEFLMPYEHALEYFTKIDILHNPESLFHKEIIKNDKKQIVAIPTYSKSYKHKWLIDYKNCEKNRSGKASPDHFLWNPQYRFDIKVIPTTIKFSLQQERFRLRGDFVEKSLKNIIIYILKIEDNRVFRSHLHYKNVIIKSNLGASRDVYFEFEGKETGRYLFVPCTEKGQYATEYLLRVFSNQNVNFKELEYDTPNELFPKNLLGCLKYKLGTIIILHELSINAPEYENSFNYDTVVEIEMICDGVKYKKEKNTSSNKISFDKNLSFIFYRRNFSKPVFINVYVAINKDSKREIVGFFRVQNVENDEINKAYYLQSYKYTRVNERKTKTYPKLNSIAVVSIYNRETLMKI